MGGGSAGTTLQPSSIPSHTKNSLSMGSSTLNHAMLQGGIHGHGPQYENSKVKVASGANKTTNRKRVYKTSAQTNSYNGQNKTSTYSFHWRDEAERSAKD